MPTTKTRQTLRLLEVYPPSLEALFDSLPPTIPEWIKVREPRVSPAFLLSPLKEMFRDLAYQAVQEKWRKRHIESILGEPNKGTMEKEE